MTDDEYQIKKKSQYMSMLLLKDELQYFDQVLSEGIKDIDSWLSKLRATRGVFLALHNLKDVSERTQLNGDSDFVQKTRKLRKDLIFANHFRNHGIGHLNDTLLRRAAQWHPQVFLEGAQNDEHFQTVEAQRAVIESCINSFVDKNGKQKIFETEIDLMYPPDAKQFYMYLATLVQESISWLNEAIATLGTSINYHSMEQVKELATVAGQTNFDLSEDSDMSFSEDMMEDRFANALKSLEEQNVDPKLIEFLKNGGKI